MRHDLSLCIASPEEAARIVSLLPPGRDPADILGRHWPYLEAQRQGQRHDHIVLIPAEDGVARAVFFCPTKMSPGPSIFGALAHGLPPGAWRFEANAFPEAARQEVLENAFIGFCMGAYKATLRPNDPSRAPRIVLDDALKTCLPLAESIWLGRDLINAPANLLGPSELAEAARAALQPLNAHVTIKDGEDLTENYPCLEAVGAGACRAPRVVVARWAHPEATAQTPLLSLVGKGVCFDSGGLDIKPSNAMRRMKKDMGGAALMLALTTLLIRKAVPLRIELRLGCVENSVSGAAMRPGDVLRTRAGLLVEVDNTDAEGRLVLSDLLTEACESLPDYLIDAATLTGAARVALGPDLPALFGNDDLLCDALLEAGHACGDPMWRLPLWHEYDAWLSSEIADCSNAASIPMAGSITAALFLEKFVKTPVKWAHIDSYAWNESARPGHPAGGETRGLRALYQAITRHCCGSGERDCR